MKIRKLMILALLELVGIILGTVATIKLLGAKKPVEAWCVDRISLRDNYKNINYYTCSKVKTTAQREEKDQHYLITTYKEQQAQNGDIWVLKTEWACCINVGGDKTSCYERDISYIQCQIYTEDFMQVSTDKDTTWKQEHDKIGWGYGLSWQIQFKDFFKRIFSYIGSYTYYFINKGL